MKLVTAIQMADGRTHRVGQRVRFHSGMGSRGTGTIAEIAVPRAGCVMFRLQTDPGTEYAPLDRWELQAGGYYDALRTAGVSGGCLHPLGSES